MNVNLPDGWSSELVGEVSRKVAKIEPSSLGRETFTYVDIGSIDNSSHRVVSPQVIQVGDAPGRARQHVEFGDTVFSTVRPYLRNIAWIDESLDGQIASTGFCVLRAGNRLDARFLFFFSVSDALLDQVLPLQRGVSYPAVRDKDVFAARVPLPPIEEQREIVRILEEQFSRLDAAAASIAAVRRKADQFRRSLLGKAFSGASVSRDSLTAPESWTERKLGEIADVGWGDLQTTKSSYVDSGYLAYSASGPDGFRRDFDFDQDGIVLSAIGARCGKTWYATGRWSCIKNTIRILEKSTDVKLRFLYHQLSDTNIWPKRGSGQPFISQKDARDVKVRFPEIAEQEKVVESLEAQLSHLEASTDIANQIETRIAATRRSLLHAAFSGELTKKWREKNNG